MDFFLHLIVHVQGALSNMDMVGTRTKIFRLGIGQQIVKYSVFLKIKEFEVLLNISDCTRESLGNFVYHMLQIINEVGNISIYTVH